MNTFEEKILWFIVISLILGPIIWWVLGILSMVKWILS